jgi:hypothetical protein
MIFKGNFPYCLKVYDEIYVDHLLRSRVHEIYDGIYKRFYYLNITKCILTRVPIGSVRYR